VKRYRSIVFVATLAMACTAATAFATTGPSDDPERCSERGSTVHRTVGAVTAPATPVRKTTLVPATVLAPTLKPTPAPVLARKQSTPKPSRIAPRSNTPPAPTPGMGILLKMANGASGGEVTWSSSKSADNNSGASWIL